MNTIDLAELNNKRLLVFIEDEELPNEYHQVILSQSQFKKVSDAVISGDISTEGMRKGFEAVEMQISEETIKLPDRFSDLN